MSLIESALEKMRRNSGVAGQGVESPAVRPPPSSADAALDNHASESRERPARQFAVDWAAVRTAGYMPEVSQARRFADQYRQIKRPLIEKALAATSAPDARLILVTSALPGDGKSFTAINLALSMAVERDISVLLVDADLPRSRVTEILGLPSSPGLVDALANQSDDVESYILQTDADGLEVLPAGRTVENATELLASARMREIATQLLAHNPRRLVLFDSAPLLGSSEARALVKIPGQIALVVRACVTPRQAVLDAVAHLDERRLQGLILNEAMTARGSGYYYGYTSYVPFGQSEYGAD